MQVRAANILMPGDEDTGDLTKYFTSQWIESDTELKENNYTSDKITSFDHRVKVESIWAQPWSGKATVTLVETVNTINGSHPTGEVDENGAVEGPCAPWEKRRYRVSCAKLGDAWLIENLEVLETLEPDPTPDPGACRYHAFCFTGTDGSAGAITGATAAPARLWPGAFCEDQYADRKCINPPGRADGAHGWGYG